MRESQATRHLRPFILIQCRGQNPVWAVTFCHGSTSSGLPPVSVLRVARPSRSSFVKATATATANPESGSASFTRPDASERALSPRTYSFDKDDRSIILV